MTEFNIGDTVELFQPSVRSNKGIIGTVEKITEDCLILLLVTKSPSGSSHPVGTRFSTYPNRLRKTPTPKLIDFTDIRVGDKIKTTVTYTAGTVRTVTGTVSVMGDFTAYDAGNMALCNGASTTDTTYTRTIELLDRPTPKFDPFSLGTGAVVKYVNFETDAIAVKQTTGTWTMIQIGSSDTETFFSDDLAKFDADAVTVLSKGD